MLSEFLQLGIRFVRNTDVSLARRGCSLSRGPHLTVRVRCRASHHGSPILHIRACYSVSVYPLRRSVRILYPLPSSRSAFYEAPLPLRYKLPAIQKLSAPRLRHSCEKVSSRVADGNRLPCIAHTLVAPTGRLVCRKRGLEELESRCQTSVT
jgi:hypothetical protein